MSDDIRDAWEAYYERVDRAGVESRTTSEIPLSMSRAYTKLSPGERQQIDGLLGDWVLSDDEGRRSLARLLAADYSITSLIPALRELQERLESSDAVSAPYEWAAVNRLLAELDSQR